jgi:hypothetical protein
LLSKHCDHSCKRSRLFQHVRLRLDQVALDRLEVQPALDMQKIAESQEFKQPATIDDPAILGEIAESLQPAGYAKDGLKVAS